MKTVAIDKVPTVDKVLAIDVGGTHVKLLVTDAHEPRKFASGPELTPEQMVKEVQRLTADWSYSAVSIGFPGLVVHGRIAGEPQNLGPGWVGFDFGNAFGHPVRIINDAAMQALGSYQGGRMLFLGLGTGLGSAMIVDGRLEPMELAHLPYRKGRTYEDYVGAAGLKRLGKKKWRKHVWATVAMLRAALESRMRSWWEAATPSACADSLRGSGKATTLTLFRAVFAFGKSRTRPHRAADATSGARHRQRECPASGHPASGHLDAERMRSCLGGQGARSQRAQRAHCSLAALRSAPHTRLVARIPAAPLTRHGYYELRPLDVLGRDDLVLVDVRPLDDLARGLGHIEGVRHQLGADIRARGLPLPKDTPVVLVCNNGHESRRLVIALVAEFGFTEVYHLVGGMLRWNGEERAVCLAPTWEALQ